MPRTRDSRLSRLATSDGQYGAASGERCALEARIRLCALIRDRLEAAGLDPGTLPALRLGAEAASRLAALHSARTSRRRKGEAVAEDDGDASETLILKIASVVRRQQDAAAPDLAAASLAELLAWCLVAIPPQRGTDPTQPGIVE